jgi:ubiquinol-cytochrome c reductase iron-sulfur subunit
MVQGFIVSSYLLGIKSICTAIYQQMITRVRYIRDSYKEIDVSELPPGETLQTAWNGELIFVRRLTLTEVKETWDLPQNVLLDKASQVSLSNAGNSQILVCSAICTHLGCIPVPYLGAYKGWVCLCHGSVYDKFGRVCQGPAQQNLGYINNSVHGKIVTIEEQTFPNEPSTYLYV